MLSAVSAICLGGVLAVTPTASAFDCNGARRCPYVKISNKDKDHVHYEAWGYIYSTKNPGKHIYDWHEKNPTFTLWHWRWFGGDVWRVNLKVNTDGFGANYSQTFDLAADDSVCLGVDSAGPYQSTGCTDAEDPAYGATG